MARGIKAERHKTDGHKTSLGVSAKRTNNIDYIQGVPGGKDLTSGECSLGQTIPI